MGAIGYSFSSIEPNLRRNAQTDRRTWQDQLVS